MICADFVAGANLDGAKPEVLLKALCNFLRFLPADQMQFFRSAVLEQDYETIS